VTIVKMLSKLIFMGSYPTEKIATTTLSLGLITLGDVQGYRCLRGDTVIVGCATDFSVKLNWN